MKTLLNKSWICKAISILLGLVFVVLMFPVFTGTAKATETAQSSSSSNSGSKIIVSMGDSYSSGEGVTPFYDQNLTLKEKIGSQDWLAHRSTKAWSGQLTLDGVGKMADHRNENWYFVATSGAETKHINGYFKKSYHKVYSVNVITGDFDSYKGSNQIDPQIKVLKDLKNQGKTVDYITLSLGGNDAGFSKIVTEALAESTIFYFNPGGLADKLNVVWNNFYKEGGIRDNLRKAYQDIAAAAPDAKIIVAGYPKLMDKDGKGVFSKEAAALVNDSVSRFNDEIETLVNSCKAEGMKICFVSVEEEFDRRGVKDCLNGVMLFARGEDIDDYAVASSYSMHPNEKGVEIYRSCVQAKIDQIEADGGKSEWPDMQSSDERDIVMVLDTSGSMKGEPLEQTKQAAEKFITNVLKQDASIGIVSYESSAMKLANFCMNERYLKNVIQTLTAGGGTDIEAGLLQAAEMLETSKAKTKIIVLMSDGDPNEGKVSDELIEYANSLKDKGIRIYTLGFFMSVDSVAKPQRLMENIASDGCHFEVDDAKNLVFFFNDIADQIQGTKYIYVRIACPVDVTVTFNGLALSSKNATKSQRTEFGTLTFEENPNPVSDSDDDRIKVLRLREGEEYDIRIEGNGNGTMTYSIGLMDSNGAYSDMRVFRNVEITPDTVIDTVAKKAETTVLNIDEDGDGEYDDVLKVKGENFEEDKSEKENDHTTIYVLCGVVALISLIGLVVVIRKIKNPVKSKPISVSKPISEPKPAMPTQTPAPTPIPSPAITSTPTPTPAAEYCFCMYCGEKMEADAKFCPACGKPTEPNTF